MTFFLLLLNQVILPLIFTVLFYHSEVKSWSNFILQFLFTGSFVLFALVMGAQSWTSIFLGYIITIAFLLVSIKKIRELPKTWAFKLGDNWKQVSFVIVQILLTVLFLPLSFYGISGYFIQGDKSVVNLSYPLQDGLYIVGHGGSNPIINYHNVSESQTYALDILKLNILGIRGWGIYPKDLERYAIFEDSLYSPCDGKVLKVDKGYGDMEPPERGEGHPAGNHIVIECESAEVTLAHMKQNSIVVDSLDAVKVGDLLGKVGNSGNTSEPHLHIHAEKNGKGIPIKFKGRFLVRNSLFW